MKNTETRSIPEETYQELLETERKYLLLLEFVQKTKDNLAEAQEILESMIQESKSN
jgi:hypothetical protein